MSWDDVDTDKMVARAKFQMQKAHLRFSTLINTAHLLLVPTNTTTYLDLEKSFNLTNT